MSEISMHVKKRNSPLKQSSSRYMVTLVTAGFSRLLGGKVPWHLREEAASRVLACYQDFSHLLGGTVPWHLGVEVATPLLVCYRHFLVRAVQRKGLLVLARCQPQVGMVKRDVMNVEGVLDGERCSSLEVNHQLLQLPMYLAFVVVVVAAGAHVGGSLVVVVFDAEASVRAFEHHAM